MNADVFSVMLCANFIQMYNGQIDPVECSFAPLNAYLDLYRKTGNGWKSEQIIFSVRETKSKKGQLMEIFQINRQLL